MIVVTGLGIISSLGVGVDETFCSLQQEKSGVGNLTYLDTVHKEIPCSEVKFSDTELRTLCDIQSSSSILPRTALLGILAVKEACKSAFILDTKQYRIGLINGTTVGGMEKSEQYYLDFINNDSKNEYIAAHECGACTESIADACSLPFSVVTTLSTACSSAANAVIMGANMIKEGLIDIAVVGGSECITKFHLNGFRSLMILDEQPCRPFDANRAGLNLGEGAAYIVIEDHKNATNRGVQPICALSGYGNACDAFHQTASSANGLGAQLAMREALSMSGLFPHQIDYINAHGTGTQNNDESEGIAIQSVFHKCVPLISSTKSLTGHTTSAAGGVEAVISILALKNGFVPSNKNFENKMSNLEFSPVKVAVRTPLRHVLSNSFGFGGNSASLIFSKLDDSSSESMI